MRGKEGIFTAKVFGGPNQWPYQNAFTWKGHRFVVHRDAALRGYRVSHETSGRCLPIAAQPTQKLAQQAAIAKLEEHPRRSLKILRECAAKRRPRKVLA